MKSKNSILIRIIDLILVASGIAWLCLMLFGTILPGLIILWGINVSPFVTFIGLATLAITGLVFLMLASKWLIKRKGK